MSFLEPRASFSSSFALFFSTMRHNPSKLFDLNLYMFWTKRSLSKYKSSDFWLLLWKLTKFFMSFFKPWVSFPLNFASPFSIMTHNFSEIFSWKIIYFGQKELINVQFFRLLSALRKFQAIPHAIFETTSSGFIQTFHLCLVSWKITPLYFFSSNLKYFRQ